MNLVFSAGNVKHGMTARQDGRSHPQGSTGGPPRQPLQDWRTRLKNATCAMPQRPPVYGVQ
jgi:hypothetical protein